MARRDGTPGRHGPHPGRTVVLITNDHVRRIRNVAVCRVGDETLEMLDGFRRDEVARTAPDQMHGQFEAGRRCTEFSAPLIAGVPAAPHHSVDERRIPMPVIASILLAAQVVCEPGRCLSARPVRHILRVCRSGGTGRRRGLKLSCRATRRPGSTPGSGTFFPGRISRLGLHTTLATSSATTTAARPMRYQPKTARVWRPR